MVGDISQKTYHALSEHWAHTVTLLSESEIQVWAPFTCSFNFLNKFAHDSQLQGELFGNIEKQLIFIDGYEAIDPQWEEFEKQFFYFLNLDSHEGVDIDRYIGQYPNKFFGVFLVGFDNAIKHGNTTILKHIGSLLEKHSHFSIILLTEQNIIDSDVYTDLIQKHMVVENIQYQPLLGEEDALTFLQIVAKAWNFSYHAGINKVIAENIGGHPLLLEEAARIVRDEPNVHYKDLLSNPVLVRKAHTIFKALSENDQEIIRDVLAKKEVGKRIPLSEYLERTNLLVNGKVGLQYWNYINQNLPHEHFFGDEHHNTEEEFSHVLTMLERKVFDLLLEKHIIVNRDEVAKVLWGENYEEKYSDWSIDQLMHRLREKLKLTSAPYHIKTKKGEGFVLIQD